MKITFISNYFNHHQKPFSDSMYRLIGDGYTFIETSEMREERKTLGYGMKSLPPYVKKSFISKNSLEECKKIIDDADVVILGSGPESLIQKRKKEGKLILRYQERLVKVKPNFFKYLAGQLRLLIRNLHHKKTYILCASAYTAADYNKIGLFKNRTYKWGYFPEVKQYSEDLFFQKEPQNILWCGRFIDWKHPDDVIAVAKKLRDDGYRFNVKYIGTGHLHDELKNQIKENHLEEHIEMLGSMKPEEVRSHMEKAGIYLSTSDFQEGWGAVINEAMNSGCAVVASHAVGSVPYLINTGENGLIYRSGDIEDLYKKVKYLLDNPDVQIAFGKKAYYTMVEQWNADTAAERLCHFIKETDTKGYCDLFTDGPCSTADVLENDWF